MTLAQFRARYPEFRQIGDGQLRVALEETATQLSAAVWGNIYDAGHGALTAHTLASSALDPENQQVQVYLKEYKRLVRLVAGGYRVA